MHSDIVIIGQTCTALCKRRLSILCKQSLTANSSHVFCSIIAKLTPFVHVPWSILAGYFLLITCPLLHIIQRSEEYLVSRTSPYSPRAYYCTVAEKSSLPLPANIYILVINVTTACSAANVGLLTTKEKREEKKGQLTEKEPSGWGYREL